MYSIYIQDCLKERRDCRRIGRRLTYGIADYRNTGGRCFGIYTDKRNFQLRTDRYSLKRNYSIRAFMPAVNPGISVSRVGGNAQIKAMKKSCRKSETFVFTVQENFKHSHSSARTLIKTQKMRLAKGERIVEVLKQGRNTPIRVSLQVVIIYAVINDLLEDIPVERIQEFETSLFEYIENNAHDIIDTIENTGEMSKECEEKIVHLLKIVRNVL